MQYQELLKNWERFTRIIENRASGKDELSEAMARRYTNQNIEIINDVIMSSIEHLNRLQKVDSLNDIICIQARLTDDISKKVVKAAQKFFNTSLSNVADYNEWLKANCDLSTD